MNYWKQKITAFSFLFLALPASSTYQLKDFGFGTGGVGNAASSNYSLEAVTGEQSGGSLTGSTYNLGSGLAYTNQANVPVAPAVVNSANWYNKLRVTLDESDNPSDAKYAIAVSTDGFVSDTRYVQDDQTIGVTLGLEDYQTYSTWGGGSGFLVIGLTPSTTYSFKIKAIQGKFTETGYGPTASAATAGAMLTFDIDVSATDSDTNPPFTTDLGALTPGSVSTTANKVWVDFDTNAENGGKVYVVASNTGLVSQTQSYTIGATNGNLSALSEGFGIQGSTATESSGGPFDLDAAYDLAAQNVGLADTTVRALFSASTPVTSGRGSFVLKAKSSATTPAASDYQEILTLIASANF
jgi:hypothetical protein